MGKRSIFKAFAVLLAAGTVCTACGREAVRPELLEPVNSAGEWGMVERRDLSDITIYSAQLLPEICEMSFDSDGYLYGVFVSAGDRVSEGAVLAALAGPDHDAIIALEETIENSRAGYEETFAELELDIELGKLAGRDVGELEIKLRHERERAELTLGEKEKRLAAMKEKDIGYLSLTAPCDCTVVAVTGTQPGGYTAAGTPVLAVDAGPGMTITCDYISENTMNGAFDCYAVLGGERREIEYLPYTKDELRVMSASSVDPVSRFKVLGDCSGLQAGESAMVVFVADMHEDVLVVPAGAVYSDTGGRYVYEITDDARVRRDVVTGMNDTSYIEIIEGIGEGALVYVKH